MFQQQCEMGLFTFYYEDAHSDRKQDELSRRSHLVDHEGMPRRRGAEMEEKRGKHRTEKHQSQTIKSQSPSYFQFDKQTKNVLIPHTVNLVPDITPIKIKSSREELKQKHSKEHSPVKIEQMDAREEEEGFNEVQRLLFSDEGIECHKKTLEIDQNPTIVKASCLSSLRTLKVRKQTMKEHSSMLAFQKFPSLNIQSDSLPAHSRRLPLLFVPSKRSQKKMKRMKENYLLEKICFGKETQGHVVNIGVDSTDDYKIRWKKRKEEFLTLLSRNLQDKQ